MQLIFNKTFFLFLIIITSAQTFAQPFTLPDSKSVDESLFVEIGQEIFLQKKVSNIWIEDQKVVQAVVKGSAVYLKGVSVGKTSIRLNNKENTVVQVGPVGTQKNYLKWKQISKKFLDMKIVFCEQAICIEGEIFRFKDYKKILDLIKEDHRSLYLSMKIQPKITNEIYSYIDTYLREQGLTPLKLNHQNIWKIFYGNKELAQDYKMALAKIGIQAIESKNKFEIADNVKVSIQVTEVKKEFSQSLGISLPGTYNAEIIDTSKKLISPFSAQIQANERDGYVKILASPNIICRSGKEAEFFAGGEFPIRVLNYKINDVIWKKYGINLKIKPLIDPTGQMSLQIDTEVSSLDKSVSVDGIPGLHTNRVSSYFDLIKSKTIALSGLLMNEEGKSAEGLPFLQKIPILGLLFSSQDYRNSKTELVIFVTPELMKQQETL